MERNAFIRSLDERITKFSGRILSISNNLPKNEIGRNVADQLSRSGLSVSLNFAEARSAESRKDFIHKFGITLKELREVYAILRILPDTFPHNQFDEIKDVQQEANELISILVTSLNTAKSNLK